MGVLRFVNKQFIDILQWTEAGDDVLAWRFPTVDCGWRRAGPCCPGPRVSPTGARHRVRPLRDAAGPRQQALPGVRRPAGVAAPSCAIVE